MRGLPMLKNALWKNPTGWSEKVVGTKFRFWLMIFQQIFIAFGIVFILSLLISTFYEFCLICVPVIGGTVFLPIIYIYTLSRVLRELSKEKG
jgi:hypothetical protein